MDDLERMDAFEVECLLQPTTAVQRALWYYLLWACRRSGGVARVSNTELAARLGVSESTVSRAREALQKRGLIVYKGKKGKLCEYRMSGEKMQKNRQENTHGKRHDEGFAATHDDTCDDSAPDTGENDLARDENPVTHPGETSERTETLEHSPKPRTKTKTQSTTPLPPSRPELRERFLAFWAAYPRKEARQPAAKAFAKLAPDEALFARMMAGLERDRRSEQWRRDGGQYIPYPATWLNQQRWDNGAETETPADVERPPRMGW